MQNLRAVFRMAFEKTRQDNRILSEEAADRLAQSEAAQALEKICALALDPDLPDEQALRRVREACLAQQLSFREQGI